MEMGEQLPQLHGPLVRKTLRLIVHSLVEFPAEMRFSFVQWLLFSHSIVSNSLQSHGLQHNRLPCPSPSAGTCSDSCPLREWCHPSISSSVIPSSSCPKCFPESGSFQMSQLFVSGGQSIRVSASTSVLSMNTQDWSPLEWTGWISLQSKGLSRSSPQIIFLWTSHPPLWW